MIDESIKVFIDTNVLIYAYSETEPEKKEKVLSLLEQKAVCLSTQVIVEQRHFSYWDNLILKKAAMNKI